MVDVDGVLFGVSTISLSRAVPNFIGDDGTPGTMQSNGTVLRIPEPLEFDSGTPEENVVRVGDSVRISASSPVTSTVAYRIVEITPIAASGANPPRLDLRLDLNPTLPDPPSGGSVSYVIERQPKILRSSITDLPPGYTVDLRLSGPIEELETANNSAIGANVRPLFFERLREGVAADSILGRAYSRIDVLFDSTGGISSVRTYVGAWDDGNDGDVVNLSLIHI